MTDTLHAMFIASARTHASKTSYIQRIDGAWVDLSYGDALKRVEAIGAGLMDMGVSRGDRVVVLSMSRREWALADWAILGAAAVTVPIYQTSSADESAYIVGNAGASVAIVEDAEQLGKLRAARERLADLRWLVVIDPTGLTLDADAGELTLEQLEERGHAVDGGAQAWHEAGTAVTREDLATIIYTSGTTGAPKGCMLTHHNYRHMVEQGVDPELGLFQPDDRVVLFLPLAHTFARLTQFAAARTGIQLAFTTIVTLMDDLGELKPTLMPAVPRVFEKAYTRILGQFAEATGVKRTLIDRAMKVGALRGKYIQHGRRVPPVLAAQHALYHKLVFSKIHARFGGNMRMFISGGAPLSKEVGEFFLACGIVIIEGYGLTESTTAISVNHPRNFRFGSVGRVFDGTEARIADDGELLVRGDIVFKGYHGNEEATRETIDADGWLHTGDVATFDSQGFLYITDRKKDIIVTAGGKNVAPANIENALKSTRFIGQALAFGDRKPYVTALITLDPDELATLQKTHGLSADVHEAIAAPVVLDAIRDAVAGVNAGLGRVEQVKRWRLLPIDFTTETGELTPSLKLKRKVVIERYGEWIEAMYAADAPDYDALTDPRIAALQDQPVGAR